MSRVSDDPLNQTNYGNITVLPDIDPETQGDGSIQVYGTVYTDNITSNLIGGPVNIEGTAFLDSTVSITPATTPSNSSSSEMFFVDSVDSKFKSVDSSGNITTYQPLTTLGDLSTFSSILDTQVRIPVGTSDQVLTVDTSSPYGISWKDATTTASQNIKSIVYYVPRNIECIVVDDPTGAFLVLNSPLNTKGTSGIYLPCKSTKDVGSCITQLNVNSSLTTNQNFELYYPNYSGFYFLHNYTDLEGNYAVQSTCQFQKTTVTLTGTSPSLYSSETVGAFFINISNSVGGPCAVFAICKSYASSSTANITKLNSSPGTSTSPFTRLEIEWPANSGLYIKKSTASYSGEYFVTDNFSNSNTETVVTLTGTALFSIPVQVFQFYKGKSFVVRVKSLVTNGPNAIITVSKNSETLNGNMTHISSLGYSSLERFHLTWTSQSLLSIHKSGTNYDGDYLITFSN